MVTGTKDDGLDGDYRQRLEAWDGLSDGQKRLAILDQATHLNLGGRGSPLSQERAKKVIEEFLLQMKSTWGKSRLSETDGIKIKEK